jgi:hypothetical protein
MCRSAQLLIREVDDDAAQRVTGHPATDPAALLVMP